MRKPVSDRRLIMWLGKFAFPQVNTKKTELMIVPPKSHEMYFPYFENSFSPPESSTEIRHDKIELKEYFYNGKHRGVIIRVGYYARQDVLLLESGTPYELGATSW